jgi:protein-tyrosine phosphatase
VTDPYYGDEAGFDACWTDVSTAARAIADQLAMQR